MVICTRDSTKFLKASLSLVLGVLVGLYTWTPVIKEYKVYQDKYLEQQKKLQECGDPVAESSTKSEEEVHKVEEN
mgnify:CR=1 FL=1